MNGCTNFAKLYEVRKRKATANMPRLHFLAQVWLLQITELRMSHLIEDGQIPMQLICDRVLLRSWYDDIGPEASISRILILVFDWVAICWFVEIDIFPLFNMSNVHVILYWKWLKVYCDSIIMNWRRIIIVNLYHQVWI